MRDAGLHASNVTLTLRFTDFTTITRSHTLAEPSDLDTIFLNVIRELFSRAWDGVASLRLVGVALGSFSPGSQQIDLLEAGRREKLERLVRATDRLRDRFGFSKIQLGGSLANRKERD
jgi:DNA polymerase-4